LPGVLKTRLLSHQTRGAVFAAKLLRKQKGIERVLAIAPASVKYQWKTEIEKFSNDPSCKVFLSTDAEGVGLNLQSATAVINF
jgi:SNF2 family DNA or RNA helicase